MPHRQHNFTCATSGGSITQMARATADGLQLPRKAVTAYGRKCTWPKGTRTNRTLSFRLCVCQGMGPGQLLLSTAAGAASLFGTSLPSLPATIVSAMQLQVAMLVYHPSPPLTPPPPPAPISPQRDFYSMDVSVRIQLPAETNLSASDIFSVLLPLDNLTAMNSYAAEFAGRYAAGIGLPLAGGSSSVQASMRNKSGSHNTTCATGYTARACMYHREHA